MFGFVTRHAKDYPDPLESRRTAAQWLQGLPALDVIGRQEHVLHAFEAMRQSAPIYDLERVGALLFLETALGADHHRLMKWYFENLRGSAKLADRFWQSANSVSEGFIHAYGVALETASAHPDDRRWTTLHPRLAARLIHFHGINAGLHLYRGESWTPERWAQLHALILAAAEAGIERAPTVLPGEDPLATRYSVEQEYLYVLLLHQLRTGNVTPAELDWVSTQLYMWVRDLTLDTKPRTGSGFFVDLAGSAGLTRRDGHDRGAKVGYVDTTPLVAKLDVARAELARADPDGANDARATALARLRCAVLDKVRPAIMPSRDVELRRHPRVACDLAADIRIGLSRIAHDLGPPHPPDTSAESTAPDAAPHSLHLAPASGQARGGPDLRFNERAARAELDRVAAAARRRALIEAIDSHADNTEEIELRALAGAPQLDLPFPTPVPAAESPPAAEAPAEEVLWRIKDRSVTGWRISAPGGVGQGLVLGALVAVWPADVQAWMLGVVSRVARTPDDALEAGMSLIASRVVAVTLHGTRRPRADLSIVYGGVDVSTIGPRFDGLYLMPPERVDTRLTARTLIIPASEHVEGRCVILTTPRSTYEVTLGPAIDQRADWSWVTIQVSGRAMRPGA